MLKSAFLGYAKVAQITIDAPVNQNKIEMKLLNSLDVIKLSKDKFSQELFVSLNLLSW